jgi:hypothetical protein
MLVTSLKVSSVTHFHSQPSNDNIVNDAIIAQHPGGPKPLLQYRGRDATAAFHGLLNKHTHVSYPPPFFSSASPANPYHTFGWI